MPRYVIAADNDRGNENSMRKVLGLAESQKADIIFAGDFGPSICNNPEVLDETNRTIYAVPGNWDSVEGYEDIVELEHVIDLHGKSYDGFIGQGESYEIPPVNGISPRTHHCREFDENNFYKTVKENKENSDKLVTHKPPKGLGDLVSYIRNGNEIIPAKEDDPRSVTDNQGQAFVRYVIDEIFTPRLVASGHFHENPTASDLQGNPIDSKEKSDELFINPGPTFDGFAAVIEDLEDEIRYLGHRNLD